jgi:hypothetical protein
VVVPLVPSQCIRMRADFTTQKRDSRSRKEKHYEMAEDDPLYSPGSPGAFDAA